MIVLSPLWKGGGYAGSMKYDHSSMLKTVSENFMVIPPRAAFGATDLADVFTIFP